MLHFNPFAYIAGVQDMSLVSNFSNLNMLQGLAGGPLCKHTLFSSYTSLLS